MVLLGVPQEKRKVASLEINIIPFSNGLISLEFWGKQKEQQFSCKLL
jgi:hypothetical protein